MGRPTPVEDNNLMPDPAQQRLKRHFNWWAALGVPFLLLVIIVSTILASSAIFSKPNASSNDPAQSGSLIAQENTHQGTTSWLIPPDNVATTQIQAYASALSVLPGQTLAFYVSVRQAGAPYSIDVYRLGWYGGAGGRLMFSTRLDGQAQGYYNPDGHALLKCPSCYFDPKTKLVEARWQPSFKLSIPASWITGVYLAKFTDSSNKQTYVTFDVRGSQHSTYVAVTSDTTYAAYNDWGGYSLYHGLDGLSPSRASEVSFDRPASGDAKGQGLPYEIDAIRWMERQGYDVSYISSVDLDQNPQQLLTHRAYLDLGHDEYWSAAMRNGVEQARNAGIGLAFLGANDGFWQIRFEPDSAGIADRTIVCYKNAQQDPFYGVDNSHLTINWRDPLVGRPENALIGVMYSSYAHQPTGFPWQVNEQAAAPLLAGTSLQPGEAYGCDLVGYEWDRVFNNGASPPGLQVLSTSHTLDVNGAQDFSNSTYYIAQSGALVFAAGSIYWSYSLDNTRLLSPASGCAGETAAISGMQKLLANIMAGLIVHHSPLRTPSATPTR